MSHSVEIKEKAITLRKSGLSLKDISNRLGISKSTLSIWLTNIPLSEKAQQRLAENQILGQYKSSQVRKQKRERKLKEIDLRTTKSLDKLRLSNNMIKVCCSLIWWCEGNKAISSGVRVTSSDPALIKIFLYLLRKGFSLDESKFRALVHIHKYHDDLTQKTFWSDISGIPLKQFHKSFQKPNTPKRSKEHYEGCVAISYYDANIAKELRALYHAIGNKIDQASVG